MEKEYVSAVAQEISDVPHDSDIFEINSVLLQQG